MLKLNLIYTNKTNYKIPKQSFKNIILALLREHKIDGKIEVGILFCSKNQIKNLNKKYRKLNKATSVLSFPLENKNLLGDIVICPELVKEDFNDISDALEHGILHLIGIHH